MENSEEQCAVYEPPAVVYETALEVRAGSGPLGLPDPLKLVEGE